MWKEKVSVTWIPELNGQEKHFLNLNICKLRHSNIRNVGMESRQFTI